MASDIVNSDFVSLLLVQTVFLGDQNVMSTGPSCPNSTGVENSELERLKPFLKEEITSEIKILLVESQKQLLRLLKAENKENPSEILDSTLETEEFHTSKKTVRIRGTQNSGL